MKRFTSKESPPVTGKMVIAVIIGMIVILALFLAREIYPDNPFIMKYFNRGYLVMEAIVFIGILWAIDMWRARRKEKSKKKK